MIKVLENYPFPSFREHPVRLVEGYQRYTGVLGDKPGAPHKGIDFVRNGSNGSFISFQVNAAHSGYAFRGFEESLGHFVVIYTDVFEGWRAYCSVYAHLKKDFAKRVCKYEKANQGFFHNSPQYDGTIIHAGDIIGFSGTSGWTNSLTQLHFELHEMRLKKKRWTREKIDPYGVYSDTRHGDYPQPGESLQGLAHYWAEDKPAFASF